MYVTLLTTALEMWVVFCKGMLTTSFVSSNSRDLELLRHHHRNDHVLREQLRHVHHEVLVPSLPCSCTTATFPTFRLDLLTFS